MRNKNLLLLSLLLFSVLFLNAGNVNYRVIPLPENIVYKDGKPFLLDSKVKIVYPAGNEKMKRNAVFLSSYLKDISGFEYSPSRSEKSANHAIILSLGLVSSNSEAYKIQISSNTIRISGKTEAGVFYGIQTLRKSLPSDSRKGSIIKMPGAEIQDAPRFSYRGMMLDVSRHFFTVDEIKTFLDILALHNINRFHWHLTDDQGWRIEIKKYPKLTEIGSRRDSTVIGHNSGKYDGKPYGGFYTQKQAKEIVEYAAERYITVIPEIDMPGHMLSALAAYPELGCTGGPYRVWGKWGVSEDVLCAGNDKVLDFIDEVLGELIKIFPSRYIHIGGDECPRTRWKVCQKCQARIKELGLKNDGEHSAEDQLESYLIIHAEKFLSRYGRKIIGWDEILEGNVAPSASVMSWRGISGGIKAAKLGHDVIMTPDTYLYFDHYQTDDTRDEPLAIGGYTPVQNVYNAEPVPDNLNEEEKGHIKGVQANLWTEYIPDFKQVEYMLMPRIAALSEIQWTQPAKKNYPDFLKRLQGLCAFYDLYGYNYAKHIFGLNSTFKVNLSDHSLDVNLETFDHAPVHYTLDGTEPSVLSPIAQSGILKIYGNCTLKAAAIRKSGKTKIFSQSISFNKATLKPITLYQPIYGNYYYQGAQTLVDGLTGDENYASGRWIAFCGNDLDAIIDLSRPTLFSEASFRSCIQKLSWVFDARDFKVSVSDDGFHFKEISSAIYPEMKETDPDGCILHTLSFSPIKARYVRIRIASEHSIPSWETEAAGNPGFLFIDEIIIK